MLPPGTVSSEQQVILTDYLDNGGSIYLEGTNIGSDHNGTEFWDCFGAAYLGQGALHNEIEVIQGDADNFAHACVFGYASNTYADIYINRLAPASGQSLLHSQDQFSRIINNEDDNFRTIASTLIMGALANDDIVSKKINLMKCYLAYLLNYQEAQIWLSDTSLDFGTVNPGDSQIKKLYIQNTGQGQLILSEIQIIGDGFIYEGPQELVIEFGTYLEIEVIFPAFNQGTYEAELVMQSNDPELMEVIIPLTGSCFAPPAIYVIPSEFIMEVSSGATAIFPLQILNNGGMELEYSLEIIGQNGIRNQGGPDDYGHNWQDSREEEGPVFVWNDIASTGIDSGLTGNNNYVDIELPFPFYFFGALQGQVLISSNGYLTFGTDGIDQSNDPIPSTAEPNDLIAPFWDDLNPGSQGKNYYLHDEETASLIIQYSDWEKYTSGETYDFQVVLESSGNILFFYNQMGSSLNSATVGIENHDATDGLEIAFNESFLENELAVRISTIPDWIALSSYYGEVITGQPDLIELQIDASELAPGSYEAILLIHSNDPADPELTLSLHLQVLGTSNDNHQIAQNPLLFQNYPNPFNPETKIDFFLPADGYMELVIFNLRGGKVKTLVNDIRQSGLHSVFWDGIDDNGKRVTSGVYFYKIKTDIYSITKRMILLK